MKNFFKSGAFKALAAVALFLIGMMIYSASTDGVSSIPATLTGAIVSPLQSLGASISNGFDDFIGIFTDSKELRKQNKKLQKEVNELRDKQVELDDLRRRNKLYLQYLELKEQNPDYKFADCRVIYVDPNDKYGNFTINAGQLSGVEDNQPVITPNGLVGVTYEVGLNFSKVRTILDPATQVSATVSRTNSGGVTGGSLSLAQLGRLRLNYLQRNSGVDAGDIVVTSGKGGIYPSNLHIGSTTEVKSESDGLTIYALIEPFVNIRDVTDVFVITGYEQDQEDG
ncbi:MAG: rod shape-determining protein MreC [Oscillospiraceae bacterium]|nr:rod shape-determining protein MreC [Oscillospiraceae bacterium]MDD3832770.1 rod shape-determining protein MreC [Oscillospiraceae bacterium]MDD4546927.1 rod shape-determining protein MreC [Oscillospiraceae bacterium]